MDKTVRQAEAVSAYKMGLKLMAMKANPFLSPEARNKKIGEMINEMSDIAFNQLGSVWVDEIKLTKKGSEKYKDSVDETKALMAQFPRMRPYYKGMLAMVKEHRRKGGLPC